MFMLYSCRLVALYVWKFWVDNALKLQIHTYRNLQFMTNSLALLFERYSVEKLSTKKLFKNFTTEVVSFQLSLKNEVHLIYSIADQESPTYQTISFNGASDSVYQNFKGKLSVDFSLLYFFWESFAHCIRK